MMLSSMRARQRGLALPVMLIILVVMLISSAYLLKSSNSTTMTTSNLAYESALNKAADLGLLTGFEWLSSTAATNKVALDATPTTANGYVATFDTTQNVRSDGFWSGKNTITTADGLTIDYVIHRMCSQAVAWNAGSNRCLQTSPNQFKLGSSVGLGSSLSSNALALAGATQLHYIITARISGPRGGNVINQLAVLIGV